MGGAASSAPAEAAEEDFDVLRFDALSLLEPVTTEELFEALEAEADPTAEPADQPASDQIEAEINLEVDNPENLVPKEEIDFSNNPDPPETTVEAADTAADPIVGSSGGLRPYFD